ncbi:hypothetical protein B0H63DRAFT_450479 [Podospora didyma]|uniref:Uncharacterized protein n=1 Tax=Podospora didyma TaxID=330526 RepID=A0AAE0NGH5_9PEZI|nr:hypothetical protein B0H63DRAFT_450479 [Podospora didyma]
MSRSTSPSGFDGVYTTPDQSPTKGNFSRGTAPAPGLEGQAGPSSKRRRSSQDTGDREAKRSAPREESKHHGEIAKLHARTSRDAIAALSAPSPHSLEDPEEPLRCGNARCRKLGHHLARCPGPATKEGDMDGCIFCNTQEHESDNCVKMRGVGCQHLWNMLIIDRQNLPPVRTMVNIFALSHYLSFEERLANRMPLSKDYVKKTWNPNKLYKKLRWLDALPRDPALPHDYAAFSSMVNQDWDKWTRQFTFIPEELSMQTTVLDYLNFTLMGCVPVNLIPHGIEFLQDVLNFEWEEMSINRQLQAPRQLGELAGPSSPLGDAHTGPSTSLTASSSAGTGTTLGERKFTLVFNDEGKVSFVKESEAKGKGKEKMEEESMEGRVFASQAQEIAALKEEIQLLKAENARISRESEARRVANLVLDGAVSSYRQPARADDEVEDGQWYVL